MQTPLWGPTIGDELRDSPCKMHSTGAGLAIGWEVQIENQIGERLRIWSNAGIIMQERGFHILYSEDVMKVHAGSCCSSCFQCWPCTWCPPPCPKYGLDWVSLTAKLDTVKLVRSWHCLYHLEVWGPGKSYLESHNVESVTVTSFFLLLVDLGGSKEIVIPLNKEPGVSCSVLQPD